MTFKICKTAEPPSYESLPVAKVTSYPLAQGDYRPFAQNTLCVSDTVLHLRMWAFEVNPLPASRLECVLYLFKNAPDTAITVVATPPPEASTQPSIGCCLMKNGHEIACTPEITQKLKSIAIHPHNGEDLQGVYWGYTIDIPIALLQACGGDTLLTPGSAFPGNFYKICIEEPNIHLGSYAPADFESNPYLPACMGKFEVVSY